jgi:molybdopterin-binding protein
MPALTGLIYATEVSAAPSRRLEPSADACVFHHGVSLSLTMQAVTTSEGTLGPISAREVCEELGLKAGMKATAGIKASDVLVGV